MGFLIFTDLDGTLLDHHDYAWEGARAALAEIDRRHIPLILTTSKTRAELLPLRKELGNNCPFITENGGAVFFPPDNWHCQGSRAISLQGYHVLILGREYASIREVFNRLRTDFPITGFGDMSTLEIAAVTHLAYDEAELARQREFSEPFLLAREDLLPALARAAAKYDCAVTRGGRFYHLMDRKQEKGKAVAAVIADYRSSFGHCTTIGLGDSTNDLTMLDNVDIPVLIARPDGSHEPYEVPGLLRSKHPGCRGWGETVLQIISTPPAQL